MRRLDRLILGEIIGPWLFGVAIFTVLIMAGTYLFKITDYIVKGIGPGLIAELTMLLLPGVLAKTFPMAVLLATLLAFGRLSSDSEIVAVRAAGTSLTRIMVPVGLFGFAVAVVAFFFNNFLVPKAAIRGTEIQSQIANKLQGYNFRPATYQITDKGKLRAQIMAKDFSISDRSLKGATLVAYGEDLQPSFILLAEELLYESETKWRLNGRASILSADGASYAVIKDGAWPPEVPKPSFSPADLIAMTLTDLDSMSMEQIKQQVAKSRENPNFPKSQIANLEYGYWNKIALPLAALIYALVGAPLGIRNHRTGAAAGFWISVIIIFGYLMLANFMAVYAKGGVIPSWMASFMPLAIGLIVAAVAIYKKNT